MRQKIGILVHFSQHTDPLDAGRVCSYLQDLLACFASPDVALSGQAEITATDADETQRFELSSIADWNTAASQITPSACHISMELTDAAYGMVALGASIARHPHRTAQMIDHEQTLRLSIEQKLWTKLRHSMTDCLMRLCTQGDISYVAVDRDATLPNSIYQANLRLFADKMAASRVDVESRIPGVYWMQYLGRSMLTDEVRQALTSSGLFVQQIGDGLWVQTAKSISSDSAAMHKVLYDLIQPQTYAPDEKTMAEYRRLQPWLFDRFPL